MWIERKSLGQVEKKLSRHTLSESEIETWQNSYYEFNRLRFERTPAALKIKELVRVAVEGIKKDTADHIELAITIWEDEGIRIHFNWFEIELKRRGWQFEYDDELYHRPSK